VLGVIAVMIGGIWIFIAPAGENAEQQRLAQELSIVVGNVRAAGAAQSSLSGTADQMTNQMILAGAIPSTMVRTGATCTNASTRCADGPWGPNGGAGAGAVTNAGSFAVCAWNTAANACAAAGVKSQFFGVEIRGMKTGSCVRAVTQNTSAEGPSGLIAVFINNTNVGSSLPVTVANAQANCQAPATVDLVYRARAAAF